MSKKWLVASTGFALFSMFFGSGNLVFPISVGLESQGHYFWASLGILLTGVVVPFLGVFGMMLYRGNFQEFFSCFGKIGTFWFSLVALSLMGPFGVLARCLTVIHGALQMMLPSLSLPLTSLVLCLIVFLLAFNQNQILNWLGKILTPFLLVSIATIAFFGLSNGSAYPVVDPNVMHAFKNGFFQGYQTMDLLAAFFFSTFVIQQLQRFCSSESDRSSSLKVFFKASWISASVLSLVYILMVCLGWVYAPALENVPPQEMLGTIALEALGSLAAPCVCVAVVLACLTTAVALASLFADFLRKEVAKEKISHSIALATTLIIGFFVSTLEFAGIARFLGPILEIVYPALIVLTVINIAHKVWGFRATHWPATVTLVIKLFTI